MKMLTISNWLARIDDFAWRAAPSNGRRRIRRGCSFIGAAVAIGMCTVGAFGADLNTGNSRAAAVLSRPAPADRRPMPPHPIDPPSGELDLSAQHARIVDQLYNELMRRAAAGCSSRSTSASLGGGC